MNAAVGRRLLAEFTGTGLLVAVVVGSGIAVTRLTDDGALRLLVNSVVTALGLAVLIVVLIPAGGAHFNPVVTAADWIMGRSTPHRYGPAEAAYRNALGIKPDYAEAALNLGIVLQESGQTDRALAAYATAYRLRTDMFGSIAMALTSAPHGRLWLDEAELRRALRG